MAFLVYRRLFFVNLRVKHTLLGRQVAWWSPVIQFFPPALRAIGNRQMLIPAAKQAYCHLCPSWQLQLSLLQKLEKKMDLEENTFFQNSF